MTGAVLSSVLVILFATGISYLITVAPSTLDWLTRALIIVGIWAGTGFLIIVIYRQGRNKIKSLLKTGF